MQELLYLVHRIPYPPNKGDKIRSYHLLKHLSQRYKVHLGTFVDDERDWEYVAKVKEFCSETCFIRLNSTTSRLYSLPWLLTDRPLTLPYYFDRGMQQWVDHLLGTRSIRNVVVFSSGMAQYVECRPSVHRIIDFVDIDSDKWKQYAATKSWPLSQVYQRESRLLLDYERRIAQDFNSAAFVSEAEADFFRRLAPESANRITYFNNGVDADFFSPRTDYPCPYADRDAPVIVFTGAMDYWANVDAVDWFARAIFPAVRAVIPHAVFCIVGARPTDKVTILGNIPGVTVTGAVSDVRPYLAHASLSVAPLRIARGIQNKVLEAMAMEKVVVASPQAMEGIHATVNQELFVASNEADFAREVIALSGSDQKMKIGRAARSRVLKDYSWSESLGRMDALLARSAISCVRESLPENLPIRPDVAGDKLV
jgi:sugar transferase (PEP-CTERM/EpsH1 system associated)